MELDISSRNISILETNMGSLTKLNDLLTKNTDPTLSALNLNINEEDTQDDLFSDLYKTYKVPRVVIPKAKYEHVISDAKNVYFDYFEENNSNGEIVQPSNSNIVTSTSNIGEIVPASGTHDNIDSSTNKNFVTSTNEITLDRITYDDIVEGTSIIISDQSSINSTCTSSYIRKHSATKTKNKLLVKKRNCVKPVVLSSNQTEPTILAVESDTGVTNATKGKNITDSDGTDEVKEALQSIKIYEDLFDTSDSKDSKQRLCWSCPLIECSFTTVKLYTFQIHILKHFNTKPFKCNFVKENNKTCPWAFYSKSKRKRHLNSHNKSNEYKCTREGCGKVFATVSHLNTHLARHDVAVEYRCPHPSCDEKFKTLQQCHQHTREHKDMAPPHACEHPGCDKKFYRPSSLQTHRRVHVNDPEDLTCQVCKKQFLVACRLREHVNAVHGNIRKYKCTHEGCTWAFATNSKLKRHVSSKHMKTRRFECAVCTDSFFRLEHLKEHVQLHGIKKPEFVCPYDTCLLSFVHKASLYAHVKKKHKVIGKAGVADFEPPLLS